MTSFFISFSSKNYVTWIVQDFFKYSSTPWTALTPPIASDAPILP